MKDTDFTKMNDNIVLDKRLTPTMFRVYAVLRYHAKYKPTCHPSIDTIVAESGICRRIVIRSTNELATLGYLKKSKRFNNSTEYTLFDSPGSAGKELPAVSERNDQKCQKGYLGGAGNDTLTRGINKRKEEREEEQGEAMRCTPLAGQLSAIS